MGYWNQEWQNLRDKGCICECLNYDVDNRRDNPSCPYHHPPMESGEDMGGNHLEAAATFPQHTKRQLTEDEDHAIAEVLGGTNRSPSMTQGDIMMARAGIKEGTVMGVAAGGCVKPIGGQVASGDMYKPHKYVPSGMPGVIGAPCLMCGGSAGGAIHAVEPVPLKANEIRVEAIYDAVAGDIIRIEIENPPTDEARKILIDILPNVIDAWLQKNRDYGDSDELKSLGAKAEFVRLWNKMMKLKAGLWEGRELSGEQIPEIMGDMIAHLLLALNRAEG